MTHAQGATLTLSAFAKHLGCRPSYVTKLKQAGRLVMDDAGRVRVAESQALIEATRDPAKRPVSDRHAQARGDALDGGAGQVATDAQDEPDPAAVINPDYQAARAKREHYAALQAEADYRAKIRELLDAGQVRAVLSDILTQLRTQLEVIAPSHAPALAAMSSEADIKALLESEIESALRAAADRLQKLGRGDA